MGTLNTRCRTIRDPKRDPNFDNHPSIQPLSPETPTIRTQRPDGKYDVPLIYLKITRNRVNTNINTNNSNDNINHNNNTNNNKHTNNIIWTLHQASKFTELQTPKLQRQ